MTTIICCYNNKKQLNEMLIQSLHSIFNAIEINTIFIDSAVRGFKCAAQAYNVIIKENWESINDVIIFCHQDIAFDNMNFIKHIEEELSKEPLQILGLAGITNDGTVYSNLRYYKTKEFITKNRIKTDKLMVESIDECCFATTKKVLQQISFDEKVCSHWHLYAIDLCYNAKQINIPSYIISDSIYHKEDKHGGLYTDFHFLRTMWQLVLKYQKITKTLYTPCYIISTRPYIALLKLLKTAFKNCLCKHK